MMQIWKDIDGLPGYKVSNDGLVKSFKKTIAALRKPVMEGCGYLQIQFSIDGKLKHLKLHRLIAKAFIPNPHNKPFVNHKNGIKTDNTIENLEWCTASENRAHAIRTGLSKPQQLGKSGKLHKRSKPVVSICQTAIIEHDSINLCAKYFNVTDRAIHGALKEGFLTKGHNIYYL